MIGMTEKNAKRPRLTAKKKFEIYLATRGENAPVGEILREHGLHLAELRVIEETVEEGALESLKRRTGKAKNGEPVSVQDYNVLLRQLEKKEKALADLAVEFTILKKTTSRVFWQPR